ncbi:MAG: aminoacyl-tRNA hydrolase [Verrucomicrobiales bacterium]
MLRLITGLGNPGRDYATTRHNVGFLILDRLAARLGVSFAREKKWKAEFGRVGDLSLIKPQTFMNLSGEAVAAAAAYYKVAPEECLVVYDDKNLPFGRLRLRESGSAGGHNGMKSVIAHLGTEVFPRLRFGIGAPPGEQPELTGHVLAAFSAGESAVIEKQLDRAVEAIHYALRAGVPQAMNVFNRPEEPPSPSVSAPPDPNHRPSHEEEHV